MSFALTSSQINTLHVGAVGRGGTTAPGKSQSWERRGSKGMGRREDTAKGPDAKEGGSHQAGGLQELG